MFNFDENEYFVRTKIIGVGDFGAKLVDYSIDNMTFDVGFAVIATKDETLLKSSAPQRIKISDSVDEVTKNNISELVNDLDLLFIFTDLTDENISRQIVELSENTLLTVAIVPNSAPNKENFQNLVDSLISVDDNNIFLMYNAVRCINRLVTEPQFVAMDFSDIKGVLMNSGRGYVTYAKATGEHSVIDAMKNAINSMKDILHKSRRILFAFIGINGLLSMMELNEACNLLIYAAHPAAEILWNAIKDSTIIDYVEMIIIATDLEQ